MSQYSFNRNLVIFSEQNIFSIFPSAPAFFTELFRMTSFEQVSSVLGNNLNVLHFRSQFQINFTRLKIWRKKKHKNSSKTLTPSGESTPSRWAQTPAPLEPSASIHFRKFAASVARKCVTFDRAPRVTTRKPRKSGEAGSEEAGATSYSPGSRRRSLLPLRSRWPRLYMSVRRCSHSSFHRLRMLVLRTTSAWQEERRRASAIKLPGQVTTRSETPTPAREARRFVTHYQLFSYTSVLRFSQGQLRGLFEFFSV